jgi:hypothetical protein
MKTKKIYLLFSNGVVGRSVRKSIHDLQSLDYINIDCDCPDKLEYMFTARTEKESGTRSLLYYKSNTSICLRCILKDTSKQELISDRHIQALKKHLEYPQITVGRKLDPIAELFPEIEYIPEYIEFM